MVQGGEQETIIDCIWKIQWPHPSGAEALELYPDSVFWYGIGWYFLGIFLTDTKGKLGKDVRYCTFCGNPFFPCFCPLFDGPSPPFEGSSRKILQNGAPVKSYSTKNTIHTIPNILTGKCR